MAEPLVSQPLAAGRPDGDANTPAALWRDFLAAIAAITILRRGGAASSARIGRAALFYPVVGLLVGVALSLLDWCLRLVVSQEISSVCLVAALAIVSGGRHLEGFANTADGLIGFQNREWALSMMRDWRLGTFGASAIFFLLILKVRGFDLLAEQARTLGVLLSPMLGRWAMVVLAHGAREAGPADHVTKFSPAVGFREFAAASVITFAILFGMAEAVGLLVLVVVASLTVGLRLFLHRRLGGITDQSLGAVAEVAEMLALIVFALAA